MAVPPLSLTIICWQSLQERLSPTFSRVRAASASRTARWPGEERKERGRWRQANRMAVARSLWPGRVSSSPGCKEERESLLFTCHTTQALDWHLWLVSPGCAKSEGHPVEPPSSSFRLAEENSLSWNQAGTINPVFHRDCPFHFTS